MSPFTHLLFDADDTLFDFTKASHEAFLHLCSVCRLPWSPENEAAYTAISNELWAQLDRGQVSKEYLVVERFARYLRLLGLERNPAACNRVYLDQLGRAVFLLPHAEQVCRRLARDHRLYIVTNAVASVQRARLSASPLAPWFQGAFISEEAGACKPEAAYYDYVFSRLPGVSRENCLAIGDSLTSDIRGANHAGLPCCWFNPRGLPRPPDLRIDYEIADLRQLTRICRERKPESP